MKPSLPICIVLGILLAFLILGALGAGMDGSLERMGQGEWVE